MSSNCRLSFVQLYLGHVPVLAGSRQTLTRVQKIARRSQLWNHMERCCRSVIRRHPCSI